MVVPMIGGPQYTLKKYTGILTQWTQTLPLILESLYKTETDPTMLDFGWVLARLEEVLMHPKPQMLLLTLAQKCNKIRHVITILTMQLILNILQLLPNIRTLLVLLRCLLRRSAVKENELSYQVTGCLSRGCKGYIAIVQAGVL